MAQMVWQLAIDTEAMPYHVARDGLPDKVQLCFVDHWQCTARYRLSEAPPSLASPLQLTAAAAIGALRMLARYIRIGMRGLGRLTSRYLIQWATMGRPSIHYAAC